MQKALLIAEKPSLRKTIEDVYNKHKREIPYEIVFCEQCGHLLTLKAPDEIDESLKEWRWDTLPFHPEDYGGFKYKIITKNKERFKTIKEELDSGDYNFVINAGDPEQEGELLIRIVLSALKNKLPIKRYWSTATNEPKVLEALKNLKDDMADPMLVNLLNAAYGRQHSDYRFGMNLSRAASLKMDSRVALGRVKTPIMSIVCKREEEIKNFKPSTCYGVKAEYVENFTGQLFDSSATKAEDDKDISQGLIWFDTEDEANDFIKTLSPQAKVVEYTSKKTKTTAPKLFKLATAQIAAGKLGYSSDQTLAIIQSLYEKGYMSYPRTDCEYLSSSDNFEDMIKSATSVLELVPYIKTITRETILNIKANKKYVDDVKLAEAGHSALAPTSKKPDIETLSSEEKEIYTLICRQFIAVFLPPLLQNKTTLITEICGHSFKSNGKTLIDAGFSNIFGTKYTDVEIPVHKNGDVIEVSEFSPVSKTTTCPKRFTDADLITVCEAPHKYLFDKKYASLGKNLKIGTPATRSSIIKELIVKDKYLQKTNDKKTTYIVPTPMGVAIYNNLKDCDICKIDLTAEWEEQLEKVRKGTMSLPELEKEMISHVNRLVENIKASDMKTIEKTEKTYPIVGVCPKCGKEVKSGPKGFFCSGYKEGCKFGAYKGICDSIITDNEFAKLINGETIKKIIKKDKSKWEQEINFDVNTGKYIFVKNEPTSVEYKCPQCGGSMTDKGIIIECDSNCGFKFWKNRSDGKSLTSSQINSFFTTGSTGTIKGIRKKSGGAFNAAIVLKEDKSGVEYKFPASKKGKF